MKDFNEFRYNKDVANNLIIITVATIGSAIFMIAAFSQLL